MRAWRPLALVLATAACAGGDGVGPLTPDEVRVLRPSPAGTFRMVGTEEDSRTGRVERVVEIYRVDPGFVRAGEERQLTELRDTTGRSRTWETAYRPTGAYRLHEKTEEASWDWAPPLRSIALPLRAGRSWSYRSGVTLPDITGTRRTTTVAGRSEVKGTATVEVAGAKVFVFVLDGSVSTTVTDTNRVTREETTFVTEVAGRTWFSPEHSRMVRSRSTTRVRRRDAEAGGDYVLTRRVELERL